MAILLNLVKSNRTRNAIKRDIRYLMPRVLLVEIVGVSAAEECS